MGFLGGVLTLKVDRVSKKAGHEERRKVAPRATSVSGGDQACIHIQSVSSAAAAAAVAAAIGLSDSTRRDVGIYRRENRVIAQLNGT